MAEVMNKNSRTAPAEYAPEVKRSYFDGSALQLAGRRLLALLLTLVTLGLAWPWAVCMTARWEVKHTVINGRRLKFTGTGSQLLGKYLLWCLLTVLTLGIYSIWFAVGVKKWRVRHTVYADSPEDAQSSFTGSAGGWLCNHVLLILLTVFTLGIGFAWGEKRLQKWEAEHTYIGGSPLVFSGTGGQLMGKYLLFVIFTVLTLGIYAFFFPVSYLKWKISHTAALYATPLYAQKSRAHEATVAQDALKFRQADHDTQLEPVKSGVTGEESDDELRVIADGGNRSAMYALAFRLKGEAQTFEGEALELLRGAALAGYHPAMLAYALSVGSEQGALYAQLLEGSAQNGNTKAPWLLKQHYEAAARKLHGHGGYDSAEQLQKAAYWFAIAMEVGDGDALQAKGQYDTMVETIALWMTERREPKEKAGALPVILCVTAILFVIGSVAAVTWSRGRNSTGTEPAEAPSAVQLWCDGRTVGNGSELYQSVPWEPGVVSYENFEVVNTGSEAMTFTLRLDSGEADTVIQAVALERKVSSEDLEPIMKQDTAFVTVEEFVLTRTVAPGETYRTAVILYWPGGVPAQIPDGMTVPVRLSIHAEFDTQT